MTTPRRQARHGTTTRYRKGCRCDRCRAANTKAKSAQRARARQAGPKPILSLVPDVQPSSTSDTTEPSPPAEKPATNNVPAWSATETAIRQDLATFDHSVPFFSTLQASAIVLAREIDDVNSRVSKAPLVKQLVDVVRELKGKDAGDGQSFEDLLADLAKPPTLAGAEDWH